MSDEFHHLIEELQKRLRELEQEVIRLRAEFGPVKLFVFGLVTLMLSAVGIALAAMVLK